MGISSALGGAIAWWAVYYSDHQIVSLVVRYGHLAGIVVGAGTALAADREVFAAARTLDADCRRAAVQVVQQSHAVVVPAIAVVVMSGVLMAIADWPTFAGSSLFWTKMGLVGVLLANGAGLLLADRGYLALEHQGMWRRLVTASGASLILWMVILWMGAWLSVAT